jgi:hypothetical protein
MRQVVWFLLGVSSRRRRPGEGQRQRDLMCPEAIVGADDEHPDLCLCLTFPPHLRPMFKLERGSLFAPRVS